MDFRSLKHKVNSFLRRQSYIIPLFIVTVIIWFFGFVLFILEKNYGNTQF